MHTCPDCSQACYCDFDDFDSSSAAWAEENCECCMGKEHDDEDLNE